MEELEHLLSKSIPKKVTKEKKRKREAGNEEVKGIDGEEPLQDPNELLKLKQLQEGTERQTLQEKGETFRVKIQLFREQPNKIPPVVGYFPSGYNSCKDQEDQGDGPDNKSPPRIKVYRNKLENKKNRLQFVVSPSGSKLEFVGSNYSGEAATPQLCSYSLGVLDKKTQTLKVIPIASNKIIRLEPKVGGMSDLTNKGPSNSVKTENSTNLQEQQKKKEANLQDMYGTKKDKNQARKSAALKQEDNPESQRALDAKIQEATIDKEALENTSSHIARNIPPHDLSATERHKVYPLDKIILHSEWKFLEDIDSVLQAGAPTFVSNRIYRLQGAENEQEEKTLPCLLSYITHLIRFRDEFSMDRFSSAKRHKIPSILRQKFSTMFADPGSKKLSIDKTNLLISYVLVLTLHVDGFKTNPSDIARDLSMSDITLRPHFLNLGCKFVSENRVTLAVLNAPLHFQEDRRRRGRGRGRGRG